MHREPAIHIQKTEPTPGAHFPVFIRYRKRRFQGATLRMLSNNEIELAVQALTLPPGTPVELEFLHSGRQWRLPAQVARGSSDGIGLRLDGPLPELLRDSAPA